MKRPITTSLLAAVLATSIATPGTAQFAGMTSVEPEVIDPGAVPRQELRYRFVEGQTGTMAMDMTMEMATVIDGIPAGDVQGTISITAHMGTMITDVYEDGSARVEQVFTSYAFGETGDDTADAELQSMGDQLEGITVWQVVDDRGSVLELGLGALEDLPPELRQQVVESTFAVQPFPEEAVGVGARWVASGSMNSQGLPISMSVGSEVLELTDEGVVLATTISADADGAASLLANVPDGFEAGIDEFTMDGGGDVAIVFEELIPTSHAELDLEMVMSMSGGQGDDAFATSMGLDMLMAMEVYPVE